MEHVIDRVLLDETALQAKVQELGERITRDYEGKDLLVVGILKGSLLFMADLLRAIRIPLEIDFMALSSYGSGASTSGEVRILKDLDQSIENRHVLVVEDVIDTGLTLNYLMDNLKSRGAASVKVCTILDKPERRRVAMTVDYNGFTIPDEFVVGYGLDYAQQYRHLPFVAVLKREVYGG
ncbi:hypoxanthine phosphoribosyltransferase [Heliophilum fasciatum]|uniref:Hypoxanthine phosphoribosyltransferase n=1 Tax=Heliophilum fasciatum TaxID=35700 RepID=A0A4R2RJH5_9FIRM|nr:hypoxanthine phosphoribosyltransferase [Heliophilum fasciatum]MCW2278629.1 hypoxanthine phosphoribosyltransferase [Heliophilum fasciatum]TCP62669.1 hypoxanthine phosphoribosyltransferase [Heliophilum fasciatum]